MGQTMNTTDLIYVAGHTGLVGSALVCELEQQNYTNIITRTYEELDLTDQAATNDFFATYKPAYVFLAAAKVGGIGANAAQPAEFLYTNLSIATNVIHAASVNGATKLLNLGSSCIYPRQAPQPIPESALLTGPLEQTNEAYALAKIAALKLCAVYHQQYGRDFFSLMPTNLYGPGDTYDLNASHVLPALIARFHEAKTTGAASVTLWGDGSPLREFLYVDDLAQAAVYLMQNHTADSIGDWINVGSGQEVTIAGLADIVRDIVYGDAGALPIIDWDTTKPNGTPRKLLDSSRINALSWHATTPLKDGIRAAYADYLIRLDG